MPDQPQMSHHAERWLAVRLLEDVQRTLSLGAWAERYDPQCPEDVIFWGDAVRLSQLQVALAFPDVLVVADDWSKPVIATIEIHNALALVREKHHLDAEEVLSAVPRTGEVLVRDELLAQYLDYKKSSIVPPIKHRADKLRPQGAGRVIRSV